MDIGFDSRGIDAELLAVFQAEFHGGLHDELIDGCQRGRGEPVEGPIESIVLGNSVTIELRKGAQREAIVDAIAQVAVVQVLDTHENQRAQGLLRGDAATSDVRLFQAPLQILAHEFDQNGMLLQEIGDPLQGGVEVEPQTLQLEIGDAELRDEEAAHFSSPHAAVQD